MRRFARHLMVATGLACLLAVPAWGASRDFDGDNDKITIGDVPIIQGSSAASYAVWVSADVLPPCPWGAMDLMRKDGEFNLQLHCSGSSQQGFLGAVWGGSLGGYPGQQFCAYTLTTGVWHHIVMRWDKTLNTGDAQILVDGAIACTVDGNDTANLANSSTSLLFGNNEANTEDYNGRMAHARVFNKRLSDAEVAQEQNSPGSVSGLVGYWPLSGASPEPDLSGNNNSTSILGTTVSPDSPPTGGGSDTTAPTVSLTAPSSGATVSGASVTVSANASDNVGVVGVQFKLDGANLGAEDATSPYSISWNTTTATNASHSLTATARDAAGNSTTASAVSVTVDNAAPVISSVTATNITASSATITWTTNEAATSQVEYGTTTAYGSLSPLDSSLVTSHSVALSGLNASTLYHYRVLSKDAANNAAQSADATFTTAAPGDTTPPTGSITINNNASATNSTTVTLTLSATDASGVAQMQFSNDGTTYSTPEAYATSKNWTLSAGEGTKTVNVKFKDTAGNWMTTPATDTITLDTTPPTMSFISPQDGETLSAPAP